MTKVIKISDRVGAALDSVKVGSYSDTIERLIAKTGDNTPGDNTPGDNTPGDNTPGDTTPAPGWDTPSPEVNPPVTVESRPTWAKTPVQNEYGEVSYVMSPVLADRRWAVVRQNFVPVSAEWIPTGEVWSMDYENMKWVKVAQNPTTQGEA